MDERKWCLGSHKQDLPNEEQEVLLGDFLHHFFVGSFFVVERNIF